MRLLGIIIAFALVAAAIFALGGFVTMLWLGAVYSLFDVLAPIGFIPSVGLFALSSALFNILSPNVVSK